MSSAEIVHGAPLTLPGEFLSSTEPPAKDFLDKLRRAPLPPPTRPLSYAQAAASVPPALLKAEFVYIRRGGVLPPLAPLYSGPYRVLRSAEKFFVLDIGGRPETVSVDRLKPHLGMAQVIPAQHPPRGRPATAIKASSTPS